MSKSAAILALAVAVSAGAPPAYGASSSGAPAYGGSWGSSSSSSPVGPASASSSGWSSAAGYPSSSASWSGSASGYPSGYPSSASGSWSGSASAYPSSSSSWSASASVSSSPVSTPTPTCWTKCFTAAGITGESSLCGNAEVATCINDGCCQEEAWAYWSWYNDYCGAPSSSASAYPSSSASAYASSSWASSVSSTVPSASATPTVECWSQCFAENNISSESELCGNTAVDACISKTCDCEEDKAYWAWYDSYCTASPSSSASASYSSSASPTTPVVPATQTSDCWGACFAQAGIASESELCGNTAVDQCIHDTCSPAEDKAYWSWYNSYCQATAPVTTPCVTSTTTTASATPSSPVATCWTQCFASNDVTSEASLCGNDAVSKCIHDSCSAALDKAYWEWYNGFCAAASTSVYTVTTAYTPTATPYSAITTTYVVTSGYGYTPVESSPATALPTPQGGAPAPYNSWGGAAPSASYAAATGTGAAASASAYAPVPATGAGAVTKPGVLFAAAMAFAALF